MAVQTGKPLDGHPAEENAHADRAGVCNHQDVVFSLRSLIDEALARDLVIKSLDQNQLRKALGFTGAEKPELFASAVAYARGEIK